MEKIKQQLKKISSEKRKKANEWFFKTGKGEYGEGDKFIGASMPDIRSVVNSSYKTATSQEISSLVYSEIHEERMAGLLILLKKYQASKSNSEKREIISYLLKNRCQINNWDLVDVIIPKTLGDYLLDKDRKTLYKLANSKNLWEKRIAILATFKFIDNDDFKDCLKICKILLKDPHDLTHKAMGWMLREIWKRDNKTAEDFLKKNYNNVPRTTLRYAIERMPETKRKKFLKGEFD